MSDTAKGSNKKHATSKAARKAAIAAAVAASAVKGESNGEAVEAAPAGVEVVDAPEAPADGKPTLIVKLRAATGKAIATTFASLRTYQASGVEKAMALLTKVDAATTKSLARTETFLMSTLKVEPAPASADA